MKKDKSVREKVTWVIHRNVQQIQQENPKLSYEEAYEELGRRYPTMKQALSKGEPLSEKVKAEMEGSDEGAD